MLVENYSAYVAFYLKDDEFAFKDCQEMPWLLSHDHPDLDWGSVVFVVYIDSLVGASCDLIISGMTTLAFDTKPCQY